MNSVCWGHGLCVFFQHNDEVEQCKKETESLRKEVECQQEMGALKTEEVDLASPTPSPRDQIDHGSKSGDDANNMYAPSSTFRPLPQ